MYAAKSMGSRSYGCPLFQPKNILLVEGTRPSATNLFCTGLHQSKSDFSLPSCTYVLIVHVHGCTGCMYVCAVSDGAVTHLVKRRVIMAEVCSGGRRHDVLYPRCVASCSVFLWTQDPGISAFNLVKFTSIFLL